MIGLSGRTPAGIARFSARNRVSCHRQRLFSTPRCDFETDVLIVGSGAAGLTASLRAQSLGLSPLVIEKGAKVGGTSSYSGGSVWIPCNPVSRAAGLAPGDDREAVLQYFDAAVGDVGPASSIARREAFVDEGPKMVKFLNDAGFRWRPIVGYADYFPELPGGRSDGGRGVEGEAFDLRKLGAWRDNLSKPPGNEIPPFYAVEVNRLARMRSSWTDFWFSLRLVARIAAGTLTGAKFVTLGRSLAAQLLLLNMQRNIPIWRETRLLELVMNPEGVVVGAQVQKDGKVQTIRTKNGILLCAGGFAHNKHLREKWVPSPTSTEWTLAQPGDTGDAIIAGIDVGAATALLDDAWWFPVFADPVTGSQTLSLYERARPFSMVVDASGERFLNESEPYTEFVHHMYQRNQKVKAIPAWMILDQNHRRRYMLGSLFAGQSTKKAIESGRLFQADTIEGLCEQTGINTIGLKNTMSRFNDMCRAGVDTDFRRGNNAYDHLFGDPAVGPNPSLGPVQKPPFYAVQLWPGDLGTKGGLLTDEAARVLKEDGSVIQGLYAAGNTTASVMGRSYLGAGSTLGPAMTFAFIAVGDMAKAKQQMD